MAKNHDVLPKAADFNKKQMLSVSRNKPYFWG
ncbi:hypothetical protein L1283_005484 [Sphingobacterium sp. HSC-15S19]|jgi:hypothetical protein